MKKILSICMIVKNEEKCLGRCLHSLQPLLKELDAELIITDTGSTDQTVEIAKNYTSKVSFFSWCGDFSVARNDGVAQATGEWIMSIDADEWLDDADEIISFFLSGEYKKYNTAAYKIRNYEDKEGRAYTESTAVRLFKKTQDMCYKDAIHEYIPMEPPLKIFRCFAHHTGYVYESKEALMEKHQRNLAPLLENFKIHPEDMRNLYHLLNQYRIEEDWDSMLWYEDHALNLARSKKTSSLRSGIYNLIIIAKISTGNIAEAEKLFAELMENNRYNISDMDIWHAFNKAYVKQKNWTQAMKSATEYFCLYKEYLTGEDEAESSITSTVMCGDGCCVALISEMMNGLMHDGKFELMVSFFERLKGSVFPLFSHRLQTDLLAAFVSTVEPLVLNNEILFEQRQKLFDSYVIALWDYTKCLYNPKLLNIHFLSALPRKARFAYYAKELEDKVNIGKAEKIVFLKEMVAAAKLNPVILPFLKECLEQEEITLQKNECKEPETLSEFERLGIQVKSQIRQCVESGQKDAAKQILAQYETINPNDPEIALLKQLLL